MGRLKAESMELRRMFNSSAMSAKSLAESSYSSLRDLDSSIINEDGELVLAFEAQKRILRYEINKSCELEFYLFYE